MGPGMRRKCVVRARGGTEVIRSARASKPSGPHSSAHDIFKTREEGEGRKEWRANEP